MHFTVHLRSVQTYQDDFSYGLVFIPCPVWIQGTKQILNLNPERPDYQMGSIKKLIHQERLTGKIADAKSASILIHPVGHGSIADLVVLQRDLLSEGFTVKVYGELENKGPFVATET